MAESKIRGMIGKSGHTELRPTAALRRLHGHTVLPCDYLGQGGNLQELNEKVRKQRAKPQTNVGLHPSYPIYLLLRSQA